MSENNETRHPGSQLDADEVSAGSGTPGTPEAHRGSQQPREMRYRLERNEARDALQAANDRIERMHRREVERIAGEHLAQGSDLLDISGNDVGAYLDENGDIDIDRIREDVELLLQERPGLSRHWGAFDPSQGTGGSQSKAHTPSWGSMFS